MRRALLPFVVFVVVCSGAYAGTTVITAARAQAPSHPDGGDRVKSSSSSVPVLTTDQRKDLQLRVLIYRNAQLELEAAVKDLAHPGYTIDLNTLTYVPIPVAVTP